MSNANVSGKAPAPGYKVYVDTRNFGKLGPNDPWDVSNSEGDFNIGSPNAITNMQPVRYVDPKNADGVSSPPGVEGIHIVLALGQTASGVNFALLNAPVVPPAPAPVVVPPVVEPPVVIVVVPPTPTETVTAVNPNFSIGGNLGGTAQQ